jgi:uncharacterized OB-fold protein
MGDEHVRTVIERKTVESPLLTDTDPWADFRKLEVITLELTQQYKHSLGKTSRFFIELENGRFFGTQCPRCERVYTPPRPLCPDCTQITDWIELPGTGTLKTYSVMHFTSGVNQTDVDHIGSPVIMAYVLLDGSSTLFPHLLKAKPDTIKLGMRVQVTYTASPVNHPIHLMYFTPLEKS